MQLSANNIEHILLISCALYVFVECFACARQVIAAERGIGKVPTGFRNKLSLAAHQKAAAFTSESAQSRLVLAFVSAAFAVLMTTGHGLTYLTALFETLTDNTLLVQWSLLVSIMGLMVVVSLPLEWLIRYRLRERFGYQRRSRKEWFKRTVGISTAGLAAALPATALLLILCEVTGPYWWLLVWMLYLAWLFWRWRLSLMRGKLWSRASRPIQNEALRRKVRSLLAEEGFRMEDLVIMTRPPAWKYAHGQRGTSPRRCFCRYSSQTHGRRTARRHCFAGCAHQVSPRPLAHCALGSRGFYHLCCTRLGRKHAGIF